MTIRKYLGTAIKFPLELAPGGKPATISDSDLIKQSIRLILEEIQGKRLLNNAYGSRLDEVPFLPNDNLTVGFLELLIEEAMQNFEKRVKYLDSNYTINQDRIDAVIKFEILQKNEVDSMIYPFYKNAVQ